MEELGKLSPTSRETSLEALPRKELQQLAKETGIKVLLHIMHLCWPLVCGASKSNIVLTTGE